MEKPKTVIFSKKVPGTKFAILPFALMNNLAWFGNTLRNRIALIGAVALVTVGAEATDLVWIGGTANWNGSGNWSSNGIPVTQVPGAADNAFITNTGTYTVTVPAGITAAAASLTVGGATGTQTLAIDRATLTVNGASIVNANGHLDFLVAQSVLSGPGSLTVNGTLNWADGMMVGTGTTTIGSGGILAIGSGGVTFGRTMNHSGVGTWAGGNLTMTNGVIFNNLAGGTFDITADGRLSGSSSTPINNSGLFRQTAGTTGTIVGAPFNNSGTLQVLAATLSLNFGGTHVGTFSTSVGATLALGGGSHVLAAGSHVTAGSVVGISGTATLNASGSFGVGSTLNLISGVATLTATCDVTGANLSINGANCVINYNSAAPAGAIILNQGTLGGTSPVTVTGLLSLSGGTVTNALVTANGGLTISGNTTLNGAKLVNPGLATWSAGAFTGANGAVFSNLFGATFINSFDGNAASGAGSTPIFVNVGSFRKTGASAALGTTSIDFQFINTGTVEVQTNTLRYGLNQQTAGVTLLDGGGLAAQAQPIQLLGGSLVGTGLVTVANTQNLINSSTISPGLSLGELDISGNYQQTAAGVLNIELGGYAPATGYDLVTVTAGGAGGIAMLDGTLNVTLTNGFSPTNGAIFTFLTAVSRTGAFATFNYPSNDIGMQLNLDPTSASIRVTNLKPVVANPIVAPAAATYGDPFSFQFPANTFTDPDNDPLSYTASGVPPGITFAGSTRSFSGTPTQAGVFPVAVVANDGGTPNLTTTNMFTITVNPAILAVVAQPQNKLYGAADPALTYTVSGLQFTDTPATVLSGALARTAGETVAASPCAITQGTLAANGNYNINFTGSGLAIMPASLTVTAVGKIKTYGSTLTLNGATDFTSAGLQNSETIESVTLTASGTPAGTAVTASTGSYTITPSAATGGTFNPANYTISYATGTLTVNPANLIVTASTQSKTYGATLPLGTSAFTTSGLQNSETLGVVTLTASGTPPGTAATAAAGSYTITPSAATGGTFNSANYTISYATGTLTVNPAPLMVTASAQSKTYGVTLALGTTAFTTSGLQNSEAVGVVTLTASGTPPGTAATAATGSYTITPSAATGGTFNPANYSITYATGTLTVNPTALTVTADTKTKTYGAADPAFTVSFAGFVNSDTSASLGGTLSLTRAPGENVGSYLITPSGLTSANYTITFYTGTLGITKAPLSVTADAKSKAYGGVDPAFTVTYTGLVNGDTATVLGGTLSLTRVPGETVGSYLITPSGLTSGNYTITFNTGMFSITKAALAVTADSMTKTFGTIDPTFTASYAGFVSGETPAVLTGTLILTRITGENVGSYLITPGGLSSGNYAITFNTGTLKITPPAPLLLPPTGVGTPSVLIVWTAVSNGNYRVQYKSSLTATNWTDLVGDITAIDSTASKTDFSTTSNRFYRVQVLP
jgi:hypothetical protein